jgi:hypothetical protein
VEAEVIEESEPVSVPAGTKMRGWTVERWASRIEGHARKAIAAARDAEHGWRMGIAYAPEERQRAEKAAKEAARAWFGIAYKISKSTAEASDAEWEEMRRSDAEREAAVDREMDQLEKLLRQADEIDAKAAG